MLKVMKIRLYPNKEQREKISQHFGSCRLVYNLFLDEKIKAYKLGNNLSVYDLKKQLVPLKNSDSLKFLKSVDSTALQNSVLKIDIAYKNFFRRVKKGEKPGFPQFKSKHKSYQSYQTSTSKMKEKKLYLPRIGSIRGKFHRGIPKGKIKTVTVSREANQYYASINYDDNLPETMTYNNGKKIGIDVGIKVFASLSDGSKIEVNKEHDLTKNILQMEKAQKSLSRKKKGSNNRFKAKIKLAKKHLKIKNKRMDFLHKTTKKLSENQTIVVENLTIKNMSKKDGERKTGLNRLILQQSWGKFFELLEYKLKRNDGELIKVDPKYTSQKCSKCGYIDNKNRLTQAKFQCKSCGYEANADYNASVNILNSVGITDYAS